MDLKRITFFTAIAGIIFLATFAVAQINIEAVLPPGSLNTPIGIANADDGSNRLFLVEQAGYIRILKNGVLLTTPFLDIDALTNGGGERGLLNVAFPPNYETSGKFYIYYTDLGGDVVVNRCSVSGNPDVANSNCENPPMLEVPHPNHGNHNGGGMAFGPGGYLYIAIGDGGGANDPDGNGQDKDILLGKMLRIDVSGMTGYSIPSSNPFFGATTGLDEIWAYGLRNPWRISFDRNTDDLFIGDVGQNCWEEVNFQAVNSTGGENYGWNVKEGARCFTPGGGCNNTCSNPLGTLGSLIFAYSHSATSDPNSIVITGGYRYRGSMVPSLAGKYVFADYSSGQICAITEESPGDWTNINSDLDEIELFDTNYSVSSFGEDESGELYFVDAGGGALYKFVGPGAPTFSDDFEDDAFNWNPLKGDWDETGGNLLNMAAKKSEVLTPAAFGGCGNCTIETQIQVDQENGKVSILGWYRDNKNFVELKMMPGKDKWTLKQVSNGSILRTVIAGSTQRDSDAHGKKNFMPAQKKRIGKHLMNLVRNQVGASDVLDVFQQDSEFVAPEMSRRVCISQAAFQLFAQFDQQLISHRMSETVVDSLEVIDIQCHDGKKEIFVANGQGDGAVDAIQEQSAVGQIRQVAEEGTLQQVLFALFAVADIGQRSCDLDDFSILISCREPVPQHPHIVTVFMTNSMFFFERRRAAVDLQIDFGTANLKIFGMDSLKPVFRTGSNFLFLVAEHGLPSR